MSSLKSGIVLVGSFGDTIALNAGQIVTFAHGQGRRAAAIIPIADNGGVYPVTDVNVTVNGTDSFSAQNNTAAAIAVRFLVFFEIPTPGAAGVVAANDPRISVV